jgi:hypothetical protein
MTRKVTAGHESLRASEHPTGKLERPPYELAALDEDGNELYRTEFYDTREEAATNAAELNSSDPRYGADVPDEVARFIVVETE